MMTDAGIAAGFWNWSYNTPAGKLLTRLLLSRRWVSALYGWVQRLRFSRRWIRPFIERFNIDMDEARLRPEEFGCFDDFFAREIDLARRPIHPDPRSCVAPVDGRFLVYPSIQPDEEFPIKRSHFNLRGLLRDDTIAARYSGGTLVQGRLCPGDYHHFHFAVAGVPEASVPVAGRCYALTPYSTGPHIAVHSENYRVVTRLRTAELGLVLIVEIGGFAVSSIRQSFQPGQPVHKGAPKGCFHVGGSTVLLLFEPAVFQPDRDILDHSRQGVETYVQLGDSIGRMAL